MNLLNITRLTSNYTIDINPEDFSKAFQDFFHNHFVDSYGLAREEVDLYFFNAMTKNEKEIAKHLIRQNLNLRQAQLFRASGLMLDEQALPILYNQFHSNSDLSWLLTIGQAIWRINKDIMYADLIEKLKYHPDENMKVAHFSQITDLKNEQSIDTLYHFLKDKSDLVQIFAVRRLSQILERKYLYEPKFKKEYFLSRLDDNDLKNTLVQNLKLENSVSC